MKNIFTLLFIIIVNFSMAQTTATNFTCNDCSGTSHTLFNELNAGKVIALVWVMPCSSCTGPALTTYNVVESYASNSCQVEYWMIDDYANTNCTSLGNWANTYGITNSKKFVNSAIDMNDYGSTGMPKIVIVGGPTHKVYYNADNSVNSTLMQNAINEACADIASGIFDTKVESTFQLELFPNPVVNNATLASYYLSKPTDVSIDLYNMIGKKINNMISVPKQKPGKHNFEIDCSGFSSGIYFLSFTTTEKTEYIKLVVE